MKVVCIGSGYVGSVTGTAFAALGYETTIIDINQKKVDLMNSGKSPIFEPGLDELIKEYIHKKLFATTSYEVVKEADVIFIGVGTPSKEDGTADLTYIKFAANSIAKHLNPNKFTVIVDKSTVPVGTGDVVVDIIEEDTNLQSGVHFAVVSNPEFLREGYAVEDVFFPDRVIIGSSDEKAKSIMRSLYGNLIERQNYDEIFKDFNFEQKFKGLKPKYFETDIRSAEMIKYASNSFLAVKISYINEIARLSETLGANVLDVAKGMGMDSRIGSKFLEVSSGWSGSCFPKDTAELLATSQAYNCELSTVKAAMDSNLAMHSYCVEKMERALGTLKDKKISILGLTFKPNTDDARKTQARYIIQKLIDSGAHIKAHDPQGAEMFKELNPDLPVMYCLEKEDVFEEADGLILLTHWEEYLDIPWEIMKDKMNIPFIFDTRNFLNENQLLDFGYTYEGLGIGKNKRPKQILSI
ncbi:UDP-glucose 6-dehydrogenase YwqF [Bacillus mobilis]|uniref:UDP-glucose 6-dehydrogenase n=1 Tax=Bacillus mobilis TaxID=2026190 RepID=A0A1Y5Z0U0_9BACI|nr:UDP-glucose/GDP-mannose dehydrogenase family protein [Bacillus mobilis]SMD72752.1 UDP-glucose 6-dehydrogenase YwqF [Bacillus mobilis]